MTREEANKPSPYINLKSIDPIFQVATGLFIKWLIDEEAQESENVTWDNSIQSSYDFWLPIYNSIKEPHCGDCTRVPITCSRCVAEEYLEKAENILKVIK